MQNTEKYWSKGNIKTKWIKNIINFVDKDC